VFSKFVSSMIVAGTAGIVGYWIVMLVRYRGSGSWPITSGRIESYDRASYMGDSSSGVCFTSVRYRFSVGACDYRGSWLSPQLRNDAALKEFLEKELPVGKSVEVRYKPSAPKRSELANPPEVAPEESLQQTKFSEL
jgi:hypothetical protein